MTLLYDSDNPDDIPSGVWAAGYVNGYAHVAWDARGWSRFPNAVRISVAAVNAGDALDVENGDALPWQAPGWVKMRRAAGVARPWVYVNRSNRNEVENALIAGGILTDQVALWVATLDGTQAVAAGRYPVAAVQYANSSLSGGHYDISIVNAVYAGAASDTVGPDMDATEHRWLQELHAALFPESPDTPPSRNYLNARLDALKAQIDALSAASPTTPSTAPKTVSGTFTGTVE